MNFSIATQAYNGTLEDEWESDENYDIVTTEPDIQQYNEHPHWEGDDNDISVPTNFEAQIIGTIYRACNSKVLDLKEDETIISKEANGIQGSYDYFYTSYFTAVVGSKTILIKLKYELLDDRPIKFTSIRDRNNLCEL